MSIATTRAHQPSLDKYELLDACRSRTIAAKWPTGARLLYQIAAELSWEKKNDRDQGTGYWMLPYAKGFSQRKIVRAAGLAAGSGTQLWRDLFQSNWMELTQEGWLLTPHRGEARRPRRAKRAAHGARARRPRRAKRFRSYLYFR